MPRKPLKRKATTSLSDVVVPAGAPEWYARVWAKTQPSEADKYYLDWEEAEKRVAFIERYCRAPEGPTAGQLLKLDQWQKEDIVYPMFGWKRVGSGLRRYREVMLCIPRKNAKSTLGAAIALSVLMQDGERAAQMYAAAANEDQAGIVRRIMDQMIGMDDTLSELLKCEVAGIKYERHGSFFKALTGKVRGKHGLNTHAALVDELHEHPSSELYDVLQTSMIARQQPLTFIMTTAGTDTNSFCFEKWQHALKVQRGIVRDDTFLPIVYAADPSDDWNDPKVWAKANPGLGTIIPTENFLLEYNNAKNNPSKLNRFLNLHLNIWTHAASAWVHDDTWMQSAAEFTDEDMRELPCWLGVDLASVRDMNAVAQVWYDQPNYRWYVKVHHFVNEEMVRNRDVNGGVDYISFARDGKLDITPGNATDFPYIREYVAKVASEHNVVALAYDRAYSSYLIPELVQMGIRCEPFSQSIFNMSEHIKRFEMELLKGNITHDGSRIMRWQMGCVVIHQDNSENVKLVKRLGSDAKKIDGVIASIMAFGQCVNETKAAPPENFSFEVIGLD